MGKKSNTNFVKREIYSQILSWLKEPEIVAIAGPRQAGKTTILKKLQKEIKKPVVYLSFENTSSLQDFSKAPLEFVTRHLKKAQKTYFLFDEFQYVKKGGKILKLLYDKFPQAKFIITGSSSLKIKKIASFLVGRVIFFQLYPFSFFEYLQTQKEKLQKEWKDFNKIWKNFLKEGKKPKIPTFLFENEFENAFKNYLIWGSYPAVALSKPDKKKQRLNALIETYIEKDIIKFLKIGNFLEFKNFVKILSAQIGCLLNYSSLQQDAKLTYREVKSFLADLQQTFVIKLLKPYFTNKVTEIKKSPKPYFVDSGLRNALLDDFRELDLRQDIGLLAENFVSQQMFYRYKDEKLCFWRTKQGAEVDFVLECQNNVIPIEVKYKEFKKPTFSRSFMSFLKTYKPKKAIIINKNFTGFLEKESTQILFYPLYFL